MEEIKVENNPLGLKVFANEFRLEYMPKDQLDLFISSLTEHILEYVNKQSQQ